MSEGKQHEWDMVEAMLDVYTLCLKQELRPYASTFEVQYSYWERTEPPGGTMVITEIDKKAGTITWGPMPKNHRLPVCEDLLRRRTVAQGDPGTLTRSGIMTSLLY